MGPGASVVGLDFDNTQAWPVYDWMGVAKSAFESVARYLAREFDPWLEERHLRNLAPYAEPSRYEQAQRLGGASGVFLNHPITGPVNPLAPRVVMRPDGERLLGRALYGTPYEGPPGAVHGGQIAAGFDAVLAMAGGINGRMGMTRSLSTRFLKPTPLHAELVYEAAIMSREARKTVVHGVLRAGDVVTAEGTGEFVFR